MSTIVRPLLVPIICGPDPQERQKLHFDGNANGY
jgi:hypothetical protein